MQEDHKKTMNTAKYFHVGLRPYVGQVRELKNSQNMVKSISKAAADDIFLSRLVTAEKVGISSGPVLTECCHPSN